MASIVFREEREIQRLTLQNQLMKSCEEPVLQRLLAGRQKMRILDVGCNDGSKTAAWFSRDCIAQVVGLEYDPDLALQAQERYGNETFSFFSCDVETANLVPQLKAQMAEQQIEAFDLIYISFVLMHLKKPEALLETLLHFLAPGGQLMIIEPGDNSSRLLPDSPRFGEFLDMLAHDPFAGKRDRAGGLPQILHGLGLEQITLEHTGIEAGRGCQQKKRDIFDIFFSYLPWDIALLRDREPENPQYAGWSQWMQKHYSELEKQVTAADSEVFMGISVVTCTGKQAGWNDII